MADKKGGTHTAATLAELTALNEELAALSKAGLPLEPQLRRLGRELPGMSGQLAERLGERLERGMSLSDALAAEDDRLPELYRAVVDAGLKCGRLPAALEALVDSGTRLAELRRATSAALIYPLTVIALAWGLLIFVLAVVLPKFAWFEQPRGGPFTAGLSLPRIVALAAMVVVTVVVFLLILWWRRTGRGMGDEDSRSSFLPRLPILGRIRQLADVATFAELLRLMVEQNTPLEEALDICGRATGNRRLRESALTAAASVREGSLSRLAPLRSFPPLVGLALKHADNRPLMVSSLAQAETIYRQRANDAAQWTMEYLPVVLVAGVGGTAVAALAAVVLWPYASMLETLSGPFWN